MILRPTGLMRIHLRRGIYIVYIVYMRRNNNQFLASWSPGVEEERAAYRVNGGHCWAEQLVATAPPVMEHQRLIDKGLHNQPHSENNPRLCCRDNEGIRFLSHRVSLY